MKLFFCNPKFNSGEKLKVSGFTLVEILVSMSVLSVLLLVSAQVIGQIQNTWTTSNARISQFREARTAFDIITRNLSQATLNTYLNYDSDYLNNTSATSTTAPTKYERKSDLQFICGPTSTMGLVAGSGDDVPGHAVFFQAPLGIAHNPLYSGLDRLLCARGYFVQYSSDEFFLPGFLASGNFRYRYRLMEFCPPAERNLIYSGDTGDWYQSAGAALDTDENPTVQSLTRPIADNILTLIISPQAEKTQSGPVPTWIAPAFAYNSLTNNTGSGGIGVTQGTQHQLPPYVRVVLVAIDERSAERLVAAGSSSSSPPLGSSLDTPFTGPTAAENLDSNLLELSNTLREQKLNFRIFSTTVAIRASKWSK